MFDIFQSFSLWLVAGTIVGSIIAMLFFLMKFAIGQKLHVRWHYALWLFLALRLLWPWPLVDSTTFNFLVSSSEPYLNYGATTKKNVMVSILTEASVNSIGTFHQKRFPFELVFIIWLAGFSIYLIRLIRSHCMMLRLTRRALLCSDDRILKIMIECKAKLNIDSQVLVRTSKEINSPMLYGFFRPILLIPEAQSPLYSEVDLQHIIMHEMIHLKRRDIMHNFLASILLALHWFNPIMWIAFSKYREDQELSCDAKVLAFLGRKNPISYGETLLKVCELQIIPRATSVGFASATSQIRRRIIGLHSHARKSTVLSLLILPIIFLGGCISLIDKAPSSSEEVIHSFYSAIRMMEYEKAFRFHLESMPESSETLQNRVDHFKKKLIYLIPINDGGKVRTLDHKITKLTENDRGELEAHIETNYVCSFRNGSKYVATINDTLTLVQINKERWFIKEIRSGFKDLRFYSEG